MTEGTFTFDKLRAAMRLVEQIRPTPMLASSRRFSAHKALTFKHAGRDYVGAHPHLWERFKEVPEVAPLVSGHRDMTLTIWDLDTHAAKRTEFFRALAEAMGSEKP